MLQQGAERELEPVDEGHDPHGHGGGRHQPTDAGDPQRRERRDEHQRRQPALDQTQRGVVDRQDEERPDEEVDGADAVLRQHIHEHGVAVQDLVRRTEIEVLVELHDRQESGVLPDERRFQVRDGEQQQHDHAGVEGETPSPIR
ncbi:MAG: hypothetical protein R2695_13800 [Acidimicrobiales bacterium]